MYSVTISPEDSVVTRTASERGDTHWVTPRCGCHLPQTGGWVLGHLWAVSPPRAALASLGGWPPTCPAPRCSTACYSPVPIMPTRFPLRPGPRGAGPRCWPGGFWSDVQPPWYIFSEGTQLTVTGKYLSPPFSSAVSGKSFLSVWGCFPSALPAFRTNSHLPLWDLGVGLVSG